EVHGNVRIVRGKVSDAFLVRNEVGQRGYCVVIWRGRHVADPTELSRDEASAYFEEVLRVGPRDRNAVPADQDELRDARQFAPASAHARRAALSERRRAGPSAALHAHRPAERAADPDEEYARDVAA